MSGRVAAGAISGGIAGLLIAGSFYVLSPVVGFGAMFLVWFAMWIGLAFLDRRLNRRSRLVPVFSRGMIAAVLSAPAFYLVSGIWMPFNPEGWDYLVHFGSWNVAFLPGFGALLAQLPNREMAENQE